MPIGLLGLKEIPEFVSAYAYGSYARNLLKGNASQWDGEIDIIMFTKGKNYETSQKVHEYVARLDPDIYDVSIHNIEELKGIITDVFEPDMVSRLATSSLPIYGEDLKPLFQKNKDLWKEARQKTGIETNFFSKTGDRLRHLRMGNTELSRYILNNVTIDNRILRKQNNRGLSIMRVGLTMKDIDLELNDDGPNVVKEFLTAYPNMKKYKSTMERLIEENKKFLSLSQQDAWEITKQWKKIGEAAAYTIDKYICGLIGI